MARLLLCTALYFVHQEILEVLRDSIAALNPETVELPAFSILSAMFTGAFGAALDRSAHERESRLWTMKYAVLTST